MGALEASHRGDGRSWRRWAESHGARHLPNLDQVPVVSTEKTISRSTASPQPAERRFSDDIPGLLQHADLAISRAGAEAPGTRRLRNSHCAGALLQAADRHQDANAACAVSFGLP